MEAEWLPGFREHGFALLPKALPADLTERLGACIGTDLTLTYAGGAFGAREVCDSFPEVRALLDHPAIRALVEAVLGHRVRPVKATVYDKTPDTSWSIAWHQDTAIAVRERREVPGFGWWTDRAGVPHVQPPAAIRSEMVALRLHLDACGPENGPLLVIPGSHREGKLGPEAALRHLRRAEPIACCAPAGAALVMRPLLLHASQPSAIPSQRRILHVEFAAGELPGGLRWQIER
jgi:ectoine hydroxylase-related dioxygenase (phytanoyl-CoA dioxygenase family)